MSLRMTRRAVFGKVVPGGFAAAAVGLAVAGCSDKSGDPGKGAMRKYVCGKCRYVHDPAASDPAKPFADLPADWKCPNCGSPKSRFAPKT